MYVQYFSVMMFSSWLFGMCNVLCLNVYLYRCGDVFLYL